MVQFEGVTETLTVQGVDESTHRRTEGLGGGGGREGGRERGREREREVREKQKREDKGMQPVTYCTLEQQKHT